MMGLMSYERYKAETKIRDAAVGHDNPAICEDGGVAKGWNLSRARV
jgi:hypothetical protein